MRAMYRSKAEFVRRELSRCIAAAHREVACLEFHIHGEEESLRETVVVRCRDGFLHRVDVTGDDLHQTMQNVLLALEGTMADGCVPHICATCAKREKRPCVGALSDSSGTCCFDWVAGVEGLNG